MFFDWKCLKLQPISWLDMWNVVVWRVIVAAALWTVVAACGPTGGFNKQRRGTLPRTPLVFKQHEPNVGEHHPYASGPAKGRIQRGDPRYTKELIMFSGYAKNDGIDDMVLISDDGHGYRRLMSEVNHLYPFFLTNFCLFNFMQFLEGRKFDFTLNKFESFKTDRK